MNINNKITKKILTEELNYTENEANIFLSNFPDVHSELVPVLKPWLEDRTIIQQDFDGITLEEAVKSCQSNFLMAIKYLNRIFDADISEEEKTKVKEILKKPIIIL